MRSSRSKWLAALLVALGVAGAVVLILRSGTDARAAEVRDAVRWPDSCADVVAVDTTERSRWPHAAKSVSIRCEHLGPAVLYVRFDRDAQLRADLLANTPSAPICVVGREVLIDLLDPGQFEPLCRRFNGDLIDAVSRLPEPETPDPTVEEINRSVEAREARDSAAQAKALRRHWGLTAS